MYHTAGYRGARVLVVLAALLVCSKQAALCQCMANECVLSARAKQQREINLVLHSTMMALCLHAVDVIFEIPFNARQPRKSDHYTLCL